MAHARRQHPNAVLTPAGRRRMVCVCSIGAGRSRPPQSGSRSTQRRCASGAIGLSPKAMLVCWTGQAVRVDHPTEPRIGIVARSCSCGATTAGARHTSRSRSGWPPRRCSRSCGPPVSAVSIAVIDRRARGRWPSVTSGAGPATCSTSTSRRSPPSPTAVVGGCTAAATTAMEVTPAWGTATSTPPSTTGPASPTARSSTTNKPSPPPRSCRGP